MSPGASGTETERYLSGLESPSIRNGRTIFPCGVHATTKRIFLVRSSVKMQMLAVGVWACGLILSLSALIALIVFPLTQSASTSVAAWLPVEVGGLVVLAVFSFVVQRHRDFSPVPIQEQERREIYEIDKADIFGVEMRGSDFWSSRIRIHLKSGQTRTVLFSLRETFDRVRTMFPEDPAPR